MTSIPSAIAAAKTVGTASSFTAQGTTATDEKPTQTGGTAAAPSTSSATAMASSASSGSTSGSSSNSSSTEIDSETSVTNKNGSVTTTIVYADGTTRVTTSSPDPAKASMIYTLTHPDSSGGVSAKEKNEGKSGTLYSGTV